MYVFVYMSSSIRLSVVRNVRAPYSVKAYQKSCAIFGPRCTSPRKKFPINFGNNVDCVGRWFYSVSTTDVADLSTSLLVKFLDCVF